MGDVPQAHGNPADQAERQIRAYELKLKGHSLRAIARTMTDEGMKVSHQTVANLIDKECAERVLPLADAVRKQEIDRFDTWLVKLGEQIDAGHQVARNIEVAVKVSERRARLLGADAPVQQEINATVEHKPAEVLELISQAKARSEADEAVLRGERQAVEDEAREEYGSA
jgi:hypothetical protein